MDQRAEDALQEAPEGWHPLVRALLGKLADVPGWSSDRIEQIKEKFGGLRFYYSRSNLPAASEARIERLIRAAEEQSATTCTRCGETADDVRQRTRARKLIVTQCQRCWLDS